MEAPGELERAARENSAALYLLNVDRRMDSLRGEKRFCAVPSHLARADFRAAKGES
jgi:hypothetical protein